MHLLLLICMFLASALAAPRYPTPSTGGSVLKVAMFPYWIGEHGSIPSNAFFEKYTAVSYAFGITSPNVSVVELPDTGVSLADFVDAVHQKKAQAILSIGGWDGSVYFSSAVATAENRTTFVRTITDLVHAYDLDGIDFVWQNLNNPGIGNLFLPNDTANFLEFLQELRKEAGESLYLSAAARTTPFLDENATPRTDVSDFANVLNHIVIEAYDIWGGWENNTIAGPNAPLNDSCAAEAFQKGSVVSAVEAWTAARMPPEKIILGVATYGRGFNVPSLDGVVNPDGKLISFANFTSIPLGDRMDGTNETSHTGVFNFWGLIEEGFLYKNGTANEGIQYFYDDCSQTPFVYNATSKVMVSFDDAQSFGEKGKYISEKGLAGFSMWHSGGDYQDILLNGINQGMQ